MNNQTIESLKNRRSVRKFKNEAVSKEQISAILAAGQWAPSWLNIQPWRFIVIDDPDVRSKICSSAPTLERAGVNEAPVSIAVCVLVHKMSAHLVEDAAAATLNMSIAAHSLGLGSYWVGVYDRENRRKSSESILKTILRIPDNFRLVSLLPIGVPAKVPVSRRKKLEEIVSYNAFSFSDESSGTRDEQALQLKLQNKDTVNFTETIFERAVENHVIEPPNKAFGQTFGS